MEIFYREKAFHAGKMIRKNDFSPLRKIFLLRPWQDLQETGSRCLLLCFGNNCLHYSSKCSRNSPLMDSHVLSYTSLETRGTNMPQNTSVLCLLLKDSRMDHSAKVSLWCVTILTNTRFRFFILE